MIIYGGGIDNFRTLDKPEFYIIVCQITKDFTNDIP